MTADEALALLDPLLQAQSLRDLQEWVNLWRSDTIMELLTHKLVLTPLFVLLQKLSHRDCY
jgi:hypothetical protein